MEQPHFANEYVIYFLKLEKMKIMKIMWKRGEIAPLFHNILLPVVRFSCLNRDQIFTLRLAVIRDKGR